MDRLSGKIALVTGGTSGIGAATAQLFVAEGATVVATGSSDESVAAGRDRLPAVDLLVSDASDVDAAQTLVEHVQSRYGRLDVLFVNAGTNRLALLEAVDQEAFDELVGVTFRGPYFLLQKAVPLMRNGGSIILTSSTAAVRGVAESSVYSAGKAALRSLGITLAIELAARGIRVNTITPGPISTGFGAKMGLTPEQVAGFGAMISRIPLGRMGEPDEVAAAALYFASDDSTYTTGAELRVDGGITAT